MPLKAMQDEIRTLSVAERKRLIGFIVDTLTDEPDATPRQKRSILEFEGVGAEMWRAIDTDDYLNRLRDEWVYSFDNAKEIES